jgi:protein O-mannosyl-transferase
MSDIVPESAPARRTSTLITIGLLLVLVVGTLVIYLPALRAGFVWDDDAHFTGNDAVRRWKGIIDIWSTRTAVYYPLVLTTGWALHKAVGFNPVVFHAVTLLLHIANTLLLIAILKRFRIPGAWLAGFLFAWHPMQVESVAWVTELKNTQSAFLLFLSILSLQQSGFFRKPVFTSREEKWWHWISIVLFALALMSKPSVVMAPAALVAVVWWKRGVRRWLDIDGLFAFFMLSMLASGWTVWEQRYNSGAQGFEWSQSLIERVVLSGQVFWFYLHKILWPYPVMFLYPQWKIAPGNALSWLPLVFTLLACGLCWWKRNCWGKIPGIALFWFGVFLFPVMGFFNVYFMRYAWVADHFVYLSSISIFAAAGVAWSWIFQRQKTVALAAAVAVLAGCGWLSHKHSRTFHDLETLWRSALASNPEAWMAHNNLGLIDNGRGDIAAARSRYEQALKFNPRHYEALNNLGLLLIAEGDIDGAIAMYDKALAHRPEFYPAWLNRGKAYEYKGDAAEAFASYTKASGLNPLIEAPIVNTAILAEKTGDVDLVVETYQKLLARKNLNDAEVGAFLFERAYHLDKEGNVETALKLLIKAEKFAPEIPDIHLYQGDLQERTGDFDRAVKSYRIALSLRPDWGAVLLRLSRILAAHPDPEKRNTQEALRMAEGMITSGGSGEVDIIDAYAMALASCGRYGEAMNAQLKAMKKVDPQSARHEEMFQRYNIYQRGASYTLPRPQPAPKPET